MWSFTLDNYDLVWKFIVQCLLLLGFLVLGNLIRRSIPFLKKSFIPSALIGGLLLVLVDLFVNWLVPGDEFRLVDKDIMQVITYHALAIGFIATTLKVANKEKKKGLGLMSIQNGLITGGTYMLQAVFGILTLLLFVAFGANVLAHYGVILPLSFGQGPGNAMIWTKNFEIDMNGSFGLALASIGFIVASLVGVIYLNIFRRKGQIVRGSTLGERRVEEFVEQHEIEDNDSVDKLSIQIGIVAICYAIAFGIMAALHATKSDMVQSLAWGFNFIFGVISATLVKAILVFAKKKNIIKHKYINNYQMDRISGFAFDLMIIAGVGAIEIHEVAKYIWVIIALTAVGTIITYIYVRLMTKLSFRGLEHQMFLVNFGTLTGTASNGMILLREVDSTFETPASEIFIISQFPAMIAVAPLLLLTKFSSLTFTKTMIALGIFAACAIGYTVALILIAKKKYSGEAKQI